VVKPQTWLGLFCFLFLSATPFLFAEPVVVNEQDSIKTMEIPDGAGYATNDSNVEIYLTCVNRAGGEETQEIMPGQTLTVPAETVEVRAELVDSSMGDDDISVEIAMPDGQTRTLRALPGTVRILHKEP